VFAGDIVRLAGEFAKIGHKSAPSEAEVFASDIAKLASQLDKVRTHIETN
jgi:hypothetical protein